MNKIYKVIWSKTRNCYVAVSEIAKRNGKSCTSVNCGGKAKGSRAVLALALALSVTGGAVFTMAQAAHAEEITVTGGSVTIEDNAHAEDDYILNGSNITFAVNAGGEVNSISGNSDAAVSGNTVTINGGTVNMAYVSYIEFPSGSGNWVAHPNIAGGVSNSGAVTGNQLSITNATLIGAYPTVYGGYSLTGNVSKNSVTVESNNSELYVFGGYGVTGVVGGDTAADGNIVAVKSGEVLLVSGGESDMGSVKNNQVSVSGGTVGAEVYGGYVGSGTGEATGNKVDISGGTVGAEVYGGYTYTGTAEENYVNVTGGHINGAVYGGKVYGDSTNNNGAAIKNIVSVSGSGTQIDGDIYGGNSTYGKVDGNKVTISNGKLRNVVGGTAATGDVVNNEVSVSNGSVGDIHGGLVQTGDNPVSGNTVTVTGGTVKSVYGGRTAGTGDVTGNTVNISGGTLGEVYGGRAHGTTVDRDCKAAGNKVIISGPETTTVANVYGGRAYIIALNNSVTISGGTVKYGIYGGYADKTAASNNTVTISGNATIKASIVGGLSQGDVTGNTVTISGSPNFMFEGSAGIWGGSSGNGTARYNTVNILSPIAVGFLIGGRSMSGNPADVSGNTLNLAVKNVTVGQDNVWGFQNMNFYLPADIAKDDTVLTVNSSNATDVTGVTFGVAALSGVNLQKGDTVNLLVNSNGLTTDDELQTAESSKLADASFLAPYNLATDAKYELSISKKDETTIITTVENVEGVTPEPEPEPEPGPTPTPEPEPEPGPVPTPEPDYSHNERLKSLVETREAALTMVNAGSDLLAGQGMQNAAFAAGNRAESGGFNSFAAVGLSKLRANSGSHVDVKGVGLNLGFAREIENKQGKLLFGPVVEYGHGSYDSYQDNGIKADGNTSYWGLGLIAKQTNNNGMYYEGSIRGGRVKADYDSDLSELTHASYDSTATYWAAHAGIGKLVDMGHDNTLDLYGKYFYSHTGGDSVTVHATGGDEQVSFGGVNSHRARTGARITHSINEKNAFYGGLAYQYEFSGEARATYNGGSTPSPSVKGSSGLIELGWQVKPGKGPMAIDFGVTGWVGKQRGVTANLQANWTF